MLTNKTFLIILYSMKEKHFYKNKIILSFFLLFFGCCFLFSFDVVNISNSSYVSQNPRIAIQQTGKIMAVWEETIRGKNYIYYSIKSGDTWTNPAKIPNQGSSGNINPDVFRGKSSGFVVVWHNLGCNCIKFTQYDKSWANPLTVSQSGGYDMGQPKVITTTNSRIVIAWQRGNPIMGDIYVKTHTPNVGWSGTVNVSNTSKGTSKYLDLYPGPNNGICVVWQDNKESTWEVDVLEPMMNIENGKGHWGGAFDVNTINRWCFRPVACASGSTIFVCFYYYQEKDFYASIRTNGYWDGYAPICRGWRRDHDRYYSDAAKYGSGIIYTFKDRDGDISYVVYQDGSWGNTEKISEKHDAFHPAIDYSDSVGACVVWTKRENNEIMFANFDPEFSPGPDPKKYPIAKFFFSPKQGEYPLKVSFDASASSDPDGVIVSYHWSFGDDSTGEGEKISHTYTTKGIYTVTLTVTDNDGLKKTSKDKVYVSKPPVAKFEMNRSRGVAPLTINFDASKSYDPDGTITKYSWDFGDNYYGTGKTISHTYTESGNYAVFLTVCDNHSVSATTQLKVEVYVVHAPTNVKVESKLNRNLFSIEYINVVTWSPNQFNADHGIEIVKYQIYRKEKSQATFEYRSSVTSDILTFLDRGLDESEKDSFSYTITAIDSEGHESYIYKPSSSPAGRLLFRKITD